MRYGHSIGTNLIYSPFFTLGVLLLAITGFFLVFMTQKGYKSENERILNSLNIRYAKGEVCDDQYYEIKSILEDEESNCPAIMTLKESYADGNLSSTEFIKKRDGIKAIST